MVTLTGRSARLGRSTRFAVAAFGLAASVSQAGAQDTSARRTFDDGVRLALAAQTDSALRAFGRAAAEARAAGDQITEVAAARGRADVWLVLRGCADSAVRILREAHAAAAPGDRSAADALIRLLASRGEVAESRRILVAAYSDVEHVGQSITRESVAFLLGRAANERAGGQESAALSTYHEALAIAARLHEGDEHDSLDVHAKGEVTGENAWVRFELTQLRANAKSPSIRNVRESRRMMDQLVGAWSAVDARASFQFPVIRLGDRFLLRAEQCRLEGKACPPPKPVGGC